MNGLTDGPTTRSRPATRKKRPARPRIEAAMNTGRPMPNTPAAMVKILYGIGVKPAVNRARKALFWYAAYTAAKLSGVKPRKPRLAKAQPSTARHAPQPMANPTSAPK